MKRINLYPLDTKTPFSRGYLLIAGCFFVLSCQNQKPKYFKLFERRNYKLKTIYK